MLLKRVFLAVVVASICVAQTINIGGTVQDDAGNGLPGAIVKLKNTGLSTTVGSDGAFTLQGTAGIKIKTGTGSVLSPIIFHDNMIKISLSENTPVSVRAYDITGRRILNSKKMLNAGTHKINTFLQNSGMCLYKVTIGNNAYSFKSTSFGFTSAGKNTAAGISGNPVTTSETSTSTRIRDIIFVTKDGRLDYYDSMRTSDTNGILIKMLPNAGNVTDADGNVYQSVRIGNQVWTAQNLRVTRYNDGSPITLDTSAATWGSDIAGKYCLYGNNMNTADQKMKGALYNWYAVNTGKLAPAGWHIPTDAEWDTLQNFLIANGYKYDSTIKGNDVSRSLSSKIYWLNDQASNINNYNTNGFSAIPGGCRNYNGVFLDSNNGYWWSATEFDESIVWFRYIIYYSRYLGRYYYHKEYGLSVRLVRD
jgi:uncharacterized protein (TIGR02145 family)